MSLYPCLILDVGVKFNSHKVMKQMGRSMELHELPWHSPLFTSIAYRVWNNESSPEEIVIDFALPSDAVPDEKKEEYTEKIAWACNCEADVYLSCARTAKSILESFIEAANETPRLVSHNLDTDILFLRAAAMHAGMLEEFDERIANFDMFCTMKTGMPLCKTHFPGRNTPRWPKLRELEKYLTRENTEKVHCDIVNDLMVVERCYRLLVRELEA